MLVYLDRTRDLRQTNSDSFFITFRSPYHLISSQTLGRWVKSVLDEADIDIQIFSAHLTRHAANSFAASKGISLDEIRRTAGWSRFSEVFARFYNCPIVEDPRFQNTILNLP